MTLGPLAWDIHGTILEAPRDVEAYTSPRLMWDACTPRIGATEALWKAHREGGVAYVSGASERMRQVIQEQLNAMGAPPGQLLLQDAWTGWPAYKAFKIGALEGLNARGYVADLPIDQEIAELAGVPFHAPESLGIGGFLQEVTA